MSGSEKQKGERHSPGFREKWTESTLCYNYDICHKCVPRVSPERNDWLWIVMMCQCSYLYNWLYNLLGSIHSTELCRCVCRFCSLLLKTNTILSYKLKTDISHYRSTKAIGKLLKKFWHLDIWDLKVSCYI